MSNVVNLYKVFQTVTKMLAENQQALNQADSYNQNHGDNMVATFRTITNALKQKKRQGSTDSAALGYAAKKLSKSSSGSARLYAQGLARAADKFEGKQIDERNGLDLLQTLISGGQSEPQTSQPEGGDILGSLLGGLAGGTGSQPATSGAGGDMLGSLLGGLVGGTGTQPATSGAGGDVLGSLLGGLSGGGSTSAGLQDGLDLGDLLSVGMAYIQLKQQGSSTMEALVKAFMQMSGMGNTSDRTQSTELVVSSFLQALGAEK